MSSSKYAVKEVTRWEGDPALFMDGDGSYLVWRGGQTTMDAGLHNAVEISLFTQPGWCGNYLLPEENQVGSEFEQSLQNVPITPSNLANAEAIGEAALGWLIDIGVLKEASVEIINPSGTRTETSVSVTRPDGTIEELVFTQYGVNWVYQAADPAYGRTVDGS